MTPVTSNPAVSRSWLQVSACSGRPGARSLTTGEVLASPRLRRGRVEHQDAADGQAGGDQVDQAIPLVGMEPLDRSGEDHARPGPRRPRRRGGRGATRPARRGPGRRPPRGRTRWGPPRRRRLRRRSGRPPATRTRSRRSSTRPVDPVIAVTACRAHQVAPGSVAGHHRGRADRACAGPPPRPRGPRCGRPPHGTSATPTRRTSRSDGR